VQSLQATAPKRSVLGSAGIEIVLFVGSLLLGVVGAPEAAIVLFIVGLTLRLHNAGRIHSPIVFAVPAGLLVFPPAVLPTALLAIWLCNQLQRSSWLQSGLCLTAVFVLALVTRNSGICYLVLLAAAWIVILRDTTDKHRVATAFLWYLLVVVGMPLLLSIPV